MTVVPKGYQKLDVFPYEPFVQRTITSYFERHGYIIAQRAYIDLVCYHPTNGQRWIIEAKGETSACGLDFRTGLGQILTTMHDPTELYALAVPEIDSFLRLCRGIDSQIRSLLRLHWVVVKSDGMVEIIQPDGRLMQMS